MTTDDKPAPFPIGPSDAFNGVPWKQFCAGCRAKLDAAQRSGSTTADICGDCAAMLFENGRVVKTEFSGGASPDITSVPIEFIGVTHVVGDEPDGERFFRDNKPAPPHPGPWRWVDVGGVQLVSADHVEWSEADDGHDDVLLSDRILCIPSEMSPYVRELVRAAPEMEALLRHVVKECLPQEYGMPDGKDGGILEAAEEILARIDAVAK